MIFIKVYEKKNIFLYEKSFKSYRIAEVAAFSELCLFIIKNVIDFFFKYFLK